MDIAFPPAKLGIGFGTDDCAAERTDCHGEMKNNSPELRKICACHVIVSEIQV
jgi:hypothetical protein